MLNVFGGQAGNIKYSKLTEKNILPKANTIKIQTSKLPFCRPNKMGFIMGTALGLFAWWLLVCKSVSHYPERTLERRDSTLFLCATSNLVHSRCSTRKEAFRKQVLVVRPVRRPEAWWGSNYFPGSHGCYSYEVSMHMPQWEINAAYYVKSIHGSVLRICVQHCPSQWKEKRIVFEQSFSCVTKQVMESSLLLIVEKDLGKLSSEDKTLKTGQTDPNTSSWAIFHGVLGCGE